MTFSTLTRWIEQRLLLRFQPVIAAIACSACEKFFREKTTSPEHTVAESTIADAESRTQNIQYVIVVPHALWEKMLAHQRSLKMQDEVDVPTGRLVLRTATLEELHIAAEAEGRAAFKACNPRLFPHDGYVRPDDDAEATPA